MASFDAGGIGQAGIYAAMGSGMAFDLWTGQRRRWAAVPDRHHGEEETMRFGAGVGD
ncbi:hypothetical protein [Cupriavidus sp. HPC(L)]|uniref:hypothetical protein n=1 Tax=Cupriavidus sp. HPC(L) TaxID=1217418 RepID=UPI000317DF23|nr:hypothetical protein [Cupriavidus sp. HPC(L)]